MAAPVAASLALRGWALHVLTGRGSFPNMPAASPSAWAHFLAVERCAMPLSARLATVGHPVLPATATEQLDRARHGELQRVLSAQAELARVDRIASVREWDVLVLKGTVTVLGDPRHALDLVDVDLLAAPDVARALAATLDEEGYRITGSSTAQHHATRATEGSLPVEIHAHLDELVRESFEILHERSLPVRGSSRLRRLSPKDHLLHLVSHVGVAHPYRRGAIRDLLLLQRAVQDCSASQVEETRTAIHWYRHPTPMLRLVDMAGSLAAEQGTVVDIFRYPSGIVHAVKWYGERLPLPRALKAEVGSWTVALLNGQSDLATEWAKLWMRPLGPSRAGALAWVERSLPRVGRVLRVGSRLIRAVLALLFAVPLAVLARHEARRAVRASAHDSNGWSTSSSRSEPPNESSPRRRE